MRVYIETTIPSYLTSWPSPNIVHAGHQISTHEWWENYRHNYELYTSLVTQQEAASGDPVAARRRLDSLLGIPLLAITPECEEIASAILTSGLIPAKADRDAVHRVGDVSPDEFAAHLEHPPHRERPCARRFTCAHRVPGLHFADYLHTGRPAATIMTKLSTPDVLAEVWAIKDALSASHGHNLKATCCALYAEQKKHPGDFVNLGKPPRQTEMPAATGGVLKSPSARKRPVRASA